MNTHPTYVSDYIEKHPPAYTPAELVYSRLVSSFVALIAYKTKDYPRRKIAPHIRGPTSALETGQLVNL